MSARNPLIVCADICGFSARSSAEKVKFSVSCTVRMQKVKKKLDNNYYWITGSQNLVHQADIWSDIDP